MWSVKSKEISVIIGAIGTIPNSKNIRATYQESTKPMKYIKSNIGHCTQM
jgi:hypothetical protein